MSKSDGSVYRRPGPSAAKALELFRFGGTAEGVPFPNVSALRQTGMGRAEWS
ncbi:MAG: hypothetical protein WBX38_11025 [Candidatus Sulfotelmatobacter sp.]